MRKMPSKLVCVEDVHQVEQEEIGAARAEIANFPGSYISSFIDQSIIIY